MRGPEIEGIVFEKQVRKAKRLSKLVPEKALRNSAPSLFALIGHGFRNHQGMQSANHPKL